jgi:hypothetical protein
MNPANSEFFLFREIGLVLHFRANVLSRKYFLCCIDKIKFERIVKFTIIF